MSRSIYEFRPEDAERFAREQNIKTYKIHNELRFEMCPYCKEHNSRYDKGTFYISLENGQFCCHRASCGAKGNMITLARDFNFSLGRDVDEYLHQKKRYRDLTRYARPVTRVPAVEYMVGRGISKAITESYGITTQKEHDNILVFPFFDEDGKMQFVKYRKTDFNKETDKNKEWCEANCKPILFGMDHCNAEESKVLVLTEGQIDSLSVAEAFDGEINAVSVPTGAKGFTWVPYCWNFMQKFETLTVFGDHENGHITLLEEMKARFHGVVKHVRPEDYKDCKDANELLQKYGKDAVIEAVDNAVISESPSIKRLSEVVQKQLDEDQVIDTGIHELNKILGGFYPGQLIILTGERGLGKSTLGGQFLLQAVKQRIPCLIYSGELSTGNVQKWIDLQVAGVKNIRTRITRNGFTEYIVNATAESKIHSWYSDYFFIREQTDEPLLDVIGTAIQQYGVKVILLDNLMTAMEDDMTNDFYRQQTAFVRKLAEMTRACDTTIILVAHPRKTGSGASGSNDDVSGSGNITNFANTVIWYSLPSEKDETDAPRILRVTKNRDGGGQVGKGIPLYFSKASKRIGEDPNALDWEYGWENAAEVWAEEDEAETIPF